MITPEINPPHLQSPYLCRWLTLIAGFLVLLLAWPSNGLAARIKDIASIKGVRSNQLVGYGLVIGLTEPEAAKNRGLQFNPWPVY
jgi:flagellar P-ring protein precursor FlgI